MTDRVGVSGLDTVSLSRYGVQLLKQPLTLPFQGFLPDGVYVRDRQGLAFGERYKGQTTLVESLKDMGVIDQAVFAIHFADIYNSQALPSMLTLGFWDLNKYSLDEEFLSVCAWQVGSQSLQVSSE